MLVDKIGRSLVVVDRREAAVGTGLPLVAPVVLKAGVDAPCFGQLDAARAAARHGAVRGDVVVHAVEAPAEAGGLALVELPRIALGREVDGALAIDEIDTQRIAGTGRNIDIATEGSRAAELVGRMAEGGARKADATNARTGGAGARVRAAGNLVERAGDAGIAPRLVDAQIGDDVGLGHTLVEGT